MKDKNKRYYKAFIGFLNDVTDEKIYDLFDVDVSREDDAGRFKVWFTAAMTDGYPIDYAPDGKLPILYYILSDPPIDKMYAVQKEDLTEIIRFLLEHGADVNITDRYGGNALSYAAEVDECSKIDINFDLFKEILARTKDVDAGFKTPKGVKTPLSTLCINGINADETSEINKKIKLLLDRDADVSKALEWCETAISISISKEDFARIKKRLNSYILKKYRETLEAANDSDIDCFER